ncbi:MAG: hypothetical protein DMG72_20120 [Acidobacteria bacterium]|nr:MAG: hypothetical protein DMG72_20120 [Acidobacteriota bacterium]
MESFRLLTILVGVAMFYFLYERRIGGWSPFPQNMANQRRLKYHPRQQKEVNQMDFFRYRHVCTIVLLAALAGCTHQQNSQDLKEKTAQATADVKRDAKAVAAGIREGWSRDKPLDLNTATREQLLSLPGVTAAEADRVIAGRPYDEPGELVTRRIMPKTEYDKIADWVTAKK